MCDRFFELTVRLFTKPIVHDILGLVQFYKPDVLKQAQSQGGGWP